MPDGDESSGSHEQSGGRHSQPKDGAIPGVPSRGPSDETSNLPDSASNEYSSSRPAKPTLRDDAARRAYIRSIRAVVQREQQAEELNLSSLRRAKRRITVLIYSIIVLASLAVVVGAVLAIISGNLTAGAPGLGGLLATLLAPLFRLVRRLTIDEKRSEAQAAELRRFSLTVELAEGSSPEQREQIIARLSAKVISLVGAAGSIENLNTDDNEDDANSDSSNEQ